MGEVSFGPFHLELAQRRLLRDGAAVPLGSRAMEILRTLAQAKGELVTKDELMTTVWAGQIVEENAIQVQVSALRKALGEASNGSSYVITVPGRGYRFAASPPNYGAIASGDLLDDSHKASIAVLPFLNLSEDPDQEYFADGITEDIITVLSRSKWFFVIARNSTFTYRGKAVDVRQIGRDLGVRYVLEGSVRKVGTKLRITGQLIETENGHHLWADNYDGEVADVFDFQDRVIASVAAAIEPSLRASEIERSRRKPTSSLVAYDHVLRALPYINHASPRESMLDAMAQLRRAIQLDPRYSHAKALLAITHTIFKTQMWSTPETEAEGLAVADRALASQTSDPDTLALAGMSIAYLGFRIEEGLKITERAYDFAPNFFFVAYAAGWVQLYSGNAAAALERFQRANRLNPIDPLAGSLYSGLAFAFFSLERYEEGATVASLAVADSPGLNTGYRALIVNLVGLGRLDEARDAMKTMLKAFPAMTQRTQPSYGTFHPAFWERYVANLRAAGLPE